MKINSMEALNEALLLLENENVEDLTSDKLPEEEPAVEGGAEGETEPSTGDEPKDDDDKDEDDDKEEFTEEEEGMLDEAFRTKKEHVLFESFIDKTTYANLFESLEEVEEEIDNEEMPEGQPDDIEEKEVGLDESYYLMEAEGEKKPVKEVAKEYWEKIKKFFKELWEKIKALFHRIVSKAIEAWNKLTDKYNKILEADEEAGIRGFNKIAQDNTGVKKLYDFAIEMIDENVKTLSNPDHLVQNAISEMQVPSLKDIKIDSVTEEAIKALVDKRAKKSSSDEKMAHLKLLFRGKIGNTDYNIDANISSISPREGVLAVLKGKEVNSLKELTYVKSYKDMKQLMMNSFNKDASNLKSTLKTVEKMKRDSAFTAKKLQVLSVTKELRTSPKGIVKYIGIIDSMHRDMYNFLLGAILGTIDAKRLVLIQTTSIMSACVKVGSSLVAKETV